MKDPALRFWAVEHTATMFAAIALAHVGRVLARKATTPAAKRTRLLDLLRPRDAADHPRHAVAGTAGRTAAVPRLMIPSMLSDCFRSGRPRSARSPGWPSRSSRAIVEVSMPHFGCAFVSAGAVAAAAAAFFGFGIAAQIGIFVVVMTVLARRAALAPARPARRARACRRGPSRSSAGTASSRTTSIRRSAPAASTSAARTGRRAAPSRIATGTKIRVVGADGIVLEVTRA